MAQTILTVDLTRRELSAALLFDLPHGGLFIRTDKFIGLGDELLVQLNIHELGDPVFLSGTVAWHRRPRAWSSSLPSGIGFAFDASEDSCCRFLIDFGADRVENRRHGGVRSRVEYPVKVFLDDNFVSGKTVNLSTGGLCFLTDEVIPVGASLDVVVFIDDAPQPPRCLIQVTRVDQIGGQFLVGARFQRLTPVVRRSFSMIPDSPHFTPPVKTPLAPSPADASASSFARRTILTHRR